MTTIASSLLLWGFDWIMINQRKWVIINHGDFFCNQLFNVAQILFFLSITK